MPTIINDQKEADFFKILSRFKLVSLTCIFSLVIFTFVFIGILAQHAVFAQDEYQLPYPGILPNHPLYVLKVIRDRSLEFFTRDPMKKAQLYLLFADKRIFMAQLIFDKDWKTTEKTASRAEKYLLKVRESLEEAQKIGVSPEFGLVDKCISSAKKHRQILQSLRKHAPRQLQSGIIDSLRINQEFAVWIKALDQK